LQAWGIETVRCDLLDTTAFAKLPDAANVVFMAGMKFGFDGTGVADVGQQYFLARAGLRTAFAIAESRFSRQEMCTGCHQLPEEARAKKMR